MLDTDKIAEVIRAETQIHPVSSEIMLGESLIDALADAFEAIVHLCGYRCATRGCNPMEYVNEFDRAAFVAKCRGGDAG